MVKTSKNSQNFDFVLIPFIQKLQKMVKTSKNAQNFEKWRRSRWASYAQPKELKMAKTSRNDENFEKRHLRGESLEPLASSRSVRSELLKSTGPKFRALGA